MAQLANARQTRGGREANARRARGNDAVKVENRTLPRPVVLLGELRGRRADLHLHLPLWRLRELRSRPASTDGVPQAQRRHTGQPARAEYGSPGCLCTTSQLATPGGGFWGFQGSAGVVRGVAGWAGRRDPSASSGTWGLFGGPFDQLKDQVRDDDDAWRRRPVPLPEGPVGPRGLVARRLSSHR